MKHLYFDSEEKAEILIANQLSRKIKSYDANLMLVEVIFENGAIGEMHKHEHEQIAYCIDGEFDYYIGNETHKLRTGDTAYISPNVSHGCKLLSEKGKLLDIFTPYRKDFIEKENG